MDDSKEFLNITDAAKLLGVSRQALARAIKAGRIPGVVVIGNTCVRISKHALLGGQAVGDK